VIVLVSVIERDRDDGFAAVAHPFIAHQNDEAGKLTMVLQPLDMAFQDLRLRGKKRTIRMNGVVTEHDPSPRRITAHEPTGDEGGAFIVVPLEAYGNHPVQRETVQPNRTTPFRASRSNAPTVWIAVRPNLESWDQPSVALSRSPSAWMVRN
jgi:hypothetical protein